MIRPPKPRKPRAPATVESLLRRKKGFVVDIYCEDRHILKYRSRLDLARRDVDKCSDVWGGVARIFECATERLLLEQRFMGSPGQ